MEQLSLLFVDDDPLFLDFLRLTAAEVFPRARIDVLDRPELVAAACEMTAYDCVFLDYRMPVLDGIACTKSIRQTFPYLPIVLVTGAGDELIATAALQSGVTDYIPKSRLTAQALHRTIKNAIEVTSQKVIIEEQRKELETFAYALAHDFKQPLRQIMTFVEMITDAIEHDRTGDLDVQLAFLNNAARRLSNLVDVMSEYTLLNRPVTLGPVDLGRVFKDVRQSLAPYIKERSGEVILVSNQSVRGHSVLMGQVLQNLIVNGLKYNTSPSPRVRIALGVDDGFCTIVVSDNGIGIEEQYLEEIFSPLVRLHAEGEYSGTGLGLTLVRKAVAAQKGQISCRSTPGVGSEFIVKVPLASRIKGRSRAAKPAPRPRVAAC
jgi:signal transduction histidine kinase